VSAGAAIADWHRRLAADPGAAREQAAQLVDGFRREGILFRGEPMRTCLRPHLIDAASWRRLCEDAREVLELTARVARRAYGGDVGRLAAFLGMPSAELPWVSHDPGEPDVVWSRLDGFWAPAGPRFVEVNSDSPAGFGYADRMARVFESLPVFQQFAAERPLHHVDSTGALVETLRGVWRERRGAGDPVVAIVDWDDVPTRPDQELLREAFAARGLAARLADPRALERRDGALWCGGERVDLVYRRALLQELLPRRDEAQALLEAYRRDEAVFANSFRCRLGENKALFAILTDEDFAALLTVAERDRVARCLPWTRRVDERHTLDSGGRRIDLVPWAIANRVDLVLKPTHGYGGQSVLVGDETLPDDWETAVTEALDTPWVLQERVAIPEEPFPRVTDAGELEFEALKLNANPFYARAGGAGGIARVSRESVINVTAGGGSIPSFVLD
jgi:uncharacterized circularly permuted ATP-grasp superfamily protein